MPSNCTATGRCSKDASIYLHTDATVDVADFKIAKMLFPATAGTYAGPE